jgi:hypothetical protein
MPGKLVLTPKGLRPRSDVHKLAPGHRLEIRDGRLWELDRDGNPLTDFGPADAAAVRPAVAPAVGNRDRPRRS